MGIRFGAALRVMVAISIGAGVFSFAAAVRSQEGASSLPQKAAPSGGNSALQPHEGMAELGGSKAGPTQFYCTL
jgi:hypothetical protein